MPRFVLLFAVVFAGSVWATPKMTVCIVEKDGKPVDAAMVNLDVRRTIAEDGGEDIICRAVSKVDKPLLLCIEASVSLADGMTHVFDGYDEKPFKGTVKRAFFLDDTFPLGAAWCGENGRAIALGAENKDSYADFSATAKELKISVHAAFLRKGAVYQLAIHSFDFNAKYGVRDAFARYYPLYPCRFKRDLRVNPAIYGIAAHYGSWRLADSEVCRMMNASWDWCIGAARSWGDICGKEQPVGNGRESYTWDAENNFRDRRGVYHKHKNAEMSKETFFSVLEERLGNGYYCGVANAYYVMALAKISPIIAKRFPDSVAVGKTFTEFGFNHATEVFVFPELSWYRQLTNDFAQLVKEHDIGAIAFDVAFPRGVFRGDKLREMANVSWDEYGAGIVRGAGAAALYDYLRTLPCKKSQYRLGVISNSNGLHISDKLYADTVMAESPPWEDRAPFPLRRRLVVGEKGLTLWEGCNPRMFAPDFKLWPKDSRNSMLNSLGRCSVHRSFFAGASLPARGFLSHYASLMSYAFVRMNAAGWKAVPGALADGKDWEIARYGDGTDSYLAVNNLSRDVRVVDMAVFPGEIATGRAGAASSDGCLFVPFYGGFATNVFGESECRVSAEVGGLGVGVFENIGVVQGKGRICARWVGVPGRVTLIVNSRDFKGEVTFKDACDTYLRRGAAKRKLSPGSSISVVYVDNWMENLSKAVRAKEFEVAEIVRSKDSDALDQADRVARFFKEAQGKKTLAMPIRVDSLLPDRTILVGGVELSSSDRFEFSSRVKRFLDVLNAIQYPKYRPPVTLPKSDKGRYKLYRY